MHLFRTKETIGAIFSIGAIIAFVAFTIYILIHMLCVRNQFRRVPW